MKIKFEMEATEVVELCHSGLYPEDEEVAEFMKKLEDMPDEDTEHWSAVKHEVELLVEATLDTYTAASSSDNQELKDKAKEAMEIAETAQQLFQGL